MKKKVVKIYSASAIAALHYDPLWAEHLDHEVHILDYACFHNLKIQKISPNLHFKGRNESGWSASFENCQHLEKAEGSFDFAVSFHNSGIKAIGDLKIKNPNNQGLAVDYSGCIYLKTLRGNYPGFVIACGSGISKIEDLKIQTPKTTEFKGKLADLLRCENLASIPPHLNPEDFLLNKTLRDKLTLKRLLKREELSL